MADTEVYSDRETFYRLFMLSIILTCCTNIVRVLLAVEFKQAVIHAMRSLIARKRIIHTVKIIIICKTEQKKLPNPEESQLNRSLKGSFFF